MKSINKVTNYQMKPGKHKEEILLQFYCTIGFQTRKII